MTPHPAAIFNFPAISAALALFHGTRKSGRVFDENFKLIEDQPRAPAAQEVPVPPAERRSRKLRQAGILEEDDGSTNWFYGNVSVDGQRYRRVFADPAMPPFFRHLHVGK